jgi:hypothetical protein
MFDSFRNAHPQIFGYNRLEIYGKLLLFLMIVCIWMLLGFIKNKGKNSVEDRIDQ